MSLYIELSEFLSNPIRTGIQRIVGEICRNMPQGAAIPVQFRAGTYVALPDVLINTIGRYFSEKSEAAASEIQRIACVEGAPGITISQRDVFLVPEVFTHSERVAFFRRMTSKQWEQVRFIVYDLLPLTHPEHFHPEAVDLLYGYYHLLRNAGECAFISEETRNQYYGRLRRTQAREGIVLPLGCDSLGPRDQPTFDRPLTFAVLGTVEPRKNHKVILEAFEPLLRQIPELTLSFIGKMGWVDGEFALKVQTLASGKNPGLRFYPGLGDEAIRRHVQQSRATIYVSSAEGYGLPPVESLWLGTPVIASRTIPSLQTLGCGGIHYVEPLTAERITEAVLAFLNDAYANRKVQEARCLNLPTWKSFTEELVCWTTRSARSEAASLSGGF